MPLVERVVNEESRKLCADRILQDDIHSYAMEGLAIAFDKYDETRGASFRYYAEKKIRWTIYDNLRKAGPASRSTHRRGKFLSSATQMLKCEGKSPTPNSSTEAVHRLAENMKGLVTAFVVTVSVDRLENIAPILPDAEKNLAKKESRRTLLAYIKSLPEKEQRVVIAHFYEGRTLTDIADEMNLSLSWISKMLSSALKRIRMVFYENPELLNGLKDP